MVFQKFQSQLKLFDIVFLIQKNIEQNEEKEERKIKQKKDHREEKQIIF